MDTARHTDTLYSAHVSGIGRVLVPHPPQPQPHPAEPPKTTRPLPPLGKPWWKRLFVDAMLIPFVQGFTLSIATQWARHWRRIGGLVGVIRRRLQ
ncbi:hypothetical protein DL89DRAFT_263916 [Linderina pennispora]|uniref:Uncharacterized protein n=1 Tax=Linderina pennispora TaxID=61395 RepID=A0A1Y1WK41_9FUNG|nr:uncharacterized protein DL89DRAFT_263916 [Linderina pennispora]ORX73909.1 hypothetical protein DL89DRAFT_263916 [Linderina pennispora]